MTHYVYYESPTGRIEIGSQSDAITWLKFVDQGRERSASHPILKLALQQINEYFEGRRHEFDLPVTFSGTKFQQQVWQQLLKVPFGQTASYQDIATRVGNPKAARAVGGANHRNPIAIIVPCHRIIGSNGDLVGYGGGLWRKAWLLNHEKHR